MTMSFNLYPSRQTSKLKQRRALFQHLRIIILENWNFRGNLTRGISSFSRGITRKCKQAICLDASYRRQTQEGWLQPWEPGRAISPPIYIYIYKYIENKPCSWFVSVFHEFHEFHENLARRQGGVRECGILTRDELTVRLNTNGFICKGKNSGSSGGQTAGPKPRYYSSILSGVFVAWRGPWSLRNPPTIEPDSGWQTIKRGERRDRERST